MKFAIIGAGMAGLSCSGALQEAGLAVTLFDKGRGAGGRMATRRLQTPLGEVSLDHGAQYFTARDPAFQQLTQGWHAAGIVTPWPEAGADCWVGVPGMNAIIRRMAASQNVRWGRLVMGVDRGPGQWWLTGSEGRSGPFDAVIVAVPAEQAAPILSLHDFAMARTALLARSQPCWAGMYVFDSPLDALPPVIRQRGPIAWAARNSAKPGRSGPEAWIVQADADWSSARIEVPQDEIAALLHGLLENAAGREIPRPIAATAHRWRFALSAGTGDGALWNQALGLGVCGDWLLGPRIECAWQSGQILARKILRPELAVRRTCPKVHVPDAPISIS